MKKNKIIIASIAIFVLFTLTLISINSEAVRYPRLDDSMVEVLWTYEKGESVVLNPGDNLYYLDGTIVKPSKIEEEDIYYYNLSSGKYKGTIMDSVSGELVEISIIIN